MLHLMELIHPLMAQAFQAAHLESLLIWGITIALSSGVLTFYIRQHKNQEKQTLVAHKEAVALNIHKPQAQYPMVNTTLCIGCGSCIDACPEGGVLGLVVGKATIVNGLRCVGHGLCAAACPVEAIHVGLGDVSDRDDIPCMDDQQQTNIPGLYIAGELGGLALVKNAIKQGESVVAAIAAELEPSGSAEHSDILVVGAGPAGLSAALAAKRAGFSCVVLEREAAGGTVLQYPRKKMVLTQPVEIPLYGWLKKPAYQKEELLGIWDDIIEKEQLAIHKGRTLCGLRVVEGVFRIQTDAEEYSARRVILALGRRGTPRKLGIPGEDGAKVAYQLLDAGSYTGDRVLVVGGGDSAVEAAIALARQKGNQVTLSYRKHKFFRIKTRNRQVLEKAVAEGLVDVAYNSAPLSIHDDHVVLETEDGLRELGNDYVFIFAGGLPPFGLLQEMGIAFGAET